MGTSRSLILHLTCRTEKYEQSLQCLYILHYTRLILVQVYGYIVSLTTT